MTSDDNTLDPKDAISNRLPSLRRSKRKICPPAKKSIESPLHNRPTKKRLRKKSKKLEEKEQAASSGAAEAKVRGEPLKPKRKYRKRQKKVKEAKAAIQELELKNEENDESGSSSSLDEDDMFCCMCLCSVDFSDRDQFNWPEEVDSDTDDGNDDGEGILNTNKRNEDCDKTEGDGVESGSEKTDKKESSIVGSEKTSSKNSETQAASSKITSSASPTAQEDFYGVKLPQKMYDPNNALMICDGCNRCFHQRCHFVPILSVPRREWFCLICEYKDKLNTAKKAKTKRGRKPKRVPESGSSNTTTDSNQESNLELSKMAPLTIEELDKIYRPLIPQANVCSAALSPIVSTISPRNVGKSPYPPDATGDIRPAIEADVIIRLQHRFEFHTSQLKAGLIRKGHQQLVKYIDQNLSNMRLCQNSIRTLTETNNRARKALIEKYNRTHQLPQELVQNAIRMSRLKLKLRNVFHTIQYIVQNQDDRKELYDWFSRVKSEKRFTPAKMCIGNTKHSRSDLPVPEIISSEISSASTENQEPKVHDEIDFDVAQLESKLFAGDDVRHEPRFDIKDYDADEDDSESDGEDPKNKIKCCICFSGHVEDDNDVIMCDGVNCFRAMHMKCCAPHVTQKMLDDDENGTWFCPFCVAAAKTIHYAQAEYYGYLGDDVSVKSWEHAEQVFPEADLELKAAEKWKLGKRNDNSDKSLAALLKIEIASRETVDDASADDDESDDSFASEHESQDSASVGSGEGSQSGVDWDIGSELSALSCSENESSDENDKTGVRRSSRRKFVDSSTAGSPSGRVSDAGKLDTSNIVRGKRMRATVDYTRLNDSMFGRVKKSAIDDEEEYQFVMKTNQSGSESSTSSDGESGKEDSTSDEENDSGAEDKVGDPKQKDLTATLREGETQSTQF